ncbi:CIA30 family protein [Cyclobacterium plantarum]|uniref:CIA30 family protein n=1 Tax=Cyclobacterium plantarum TaxID=2716263 RepID=UPI003F711915
MWALQLFLMVLLMGRLLLFDFSASEDWSGWEIQNDRVMGGVSSSSLQKTEQGHALFAGSVSLENNGGFASLQYHFPSKNIEGYQTAILTLKGDGKRYQFRIKEDLSDRASYIYTFTTSGNWQTLEIPLREMRPVFRGRKLDLPNFSADSIQELRFLIGNKKEENFRLEIKKIEME